MSTTLRMRGPTSARGFSAAWSWVGARKPVASSCRARCGDCHRAPAHAVHEYGLAALAIVFPSLVHGVLRPRARRRTDPAQGRSPTSTATRRFGRRSTPACSSRFSASPCPARSHRCTASPRRSRCWWCSRLASWSARSARTQQTLMLRDMDYKRVEVLPLIGGLVGGAVCACAGRARRWGLGHHRPAGRRGRRSRRSLVW